MTKRALVTGSAGLVGAALRTALREVGWAVTGLDLRAPEPPERGDVRDEHAVAQAMDGCDGVVHLAAVSRVVWGEQDPVACRSVNVGGTRTVLDAAERSLRRPWVIIASSREVYGQAARLPVTEDAPVSPMNVYAETKVAAEHLTDLARLAGLRTAVVRLSNVYGSTSDHADRVIPAFARAALVGTPLRVDGADHTFDFTHVDDTVRGLLAVMAALEGGAARLPPIQLVTGVPTTLGELAELARELAGGSAEVVQGPTRVYDVARFYGDPGRAKALLGWHTRIGVRDGLKRLIEELRQTNLALEF